MFQLISLGKRALAVTEKHLETASHNISNVNTEGYSRQRVVQESGLPIDYPYGTIGTGVNIQSVERMRDEFLDISFRDNQSQLGFWDKRSEVLEKLETMLNEPSDFGLSNKINQFFSSWDSLSSSPTSETYRMDLINNTQQMTDGFNRMYDDLSGFVKTIDNEIIHNVSRINQISQELATLAKGINFTNGQVNDPNDLLDKYDLLVDELAKYGNITVKTTDFGQKAIYFGSDLIVDGSSARQIGLEETTVNGVTVHNLVWSNNYDKINGLKNGELLSLVDLRDNVVPSYLSQLDKIADTIKEAVNQIHLQGHDFTATREKGHYFFDQDSSGAKDFRLSLNILNDPYMIATSRSGESGDNEIALAIANLRNEAVVDGNQSISQAYASLVYKIGSDANYTNIKKENQAMTTEQVDNFRESVKGVSLNEETANLIKYQQMYQASAKIVKLADDMLKIVLGLV
ncbi:MAG: flagellar hook-associated protein FlgK [Candidatus Cloacimonadales bacterium]|jgi:flagellar hook-associated protein 1 FlgK|nr:flagellar hook-associated protein FlgK [Candidatus Cloacimonadota bacterium]MDD2650818.1 flagellar hook-associated protein FlgK [Candidatus Cloacimonadota bacterium]MDD3501655.1 flagellar hook-associated protein FlgK [Candidatus Cloacimonadota bacterium]MDX9977879.1 flagellar hook-associated protein FlgK [Candidatus Cloacimonadales bacterium]